MSINKVFLMGNLTREVDLRSTSSGKSVASFTIATNRKNGEREEVCYTDIIVWGKTAENCKKRIGKGSRVFIEGYLKLDQWEDRQTGQSLNKLRVIAENVQFINNTRDEQTQATEPNLGKNQPVLSEYAPPPRPAPRFYGCPAPEAETGHQEPPMPPVDDIPF